MRNCFVLISLLMLLQACKAQPAPPVLTAKNDGNTLLWEVSGNGLSKPTYLFGTFHLMCRSDIRFSPALRAAFGYADEVYMEMDMDDPSVLLGGLLMMGMKGGKTLKDLYTADEYRKVYSFYKDTLRAPISMLERTKPYFLLALLYPRMMKCKQVSGVEEELVKMAKGQDKKISGLETIEFQASVFDSIPYEVQARELLKNIDSLQVYAAYFDTMMRQYQQQQLASLEQQFGRSEYGLEAYMPLLLDQRNARWVDRLRAFMPGKSLFVAVGAGHLVGEKGLVNLLKKQGFTLRPILNE